MMTGRQGTVLVVALHLHCRWVAPYQSAPASSPHDSRVERDSSDVDLASADALVDLDAASVDASSTSTKVWSGEVVGPIASPALVPIGDLGPIEHAFVLCSSRTVGSSPSNWVSCRLEPGGVWIETEGISATVRWQVLRSPALRVQRGSTMLAAGTPTASRPLQPVAPAEAVVVVSSRLVGTGKTYDLDPARAVSGGLAGGSTLALVRANTKAAAIVEWQVVEWAGARVASGETSLSGTATEVLVALAAPALRTRSFLLFSSHTDDTSGFEALTETRGELIDDTQLRFNRNFGGPTVKIRWFVAELPSGTVSHGVAQGVAGGLSSFRASVTSTLDQTLVIHSVALARPGASAPSSADLDSARFTAELTGTEVVLQRGRATAVPVDLSWSAVHVP